MFWEVWRNVTSATTNWGLGGNSNKKGRQSSKSSKKSCYHPLLSSSSHISGDGEGFPKKSISQPVSLTQFTRESSCDRDYYTPTLESSHSSPNDTTNNNNVSNSSSNSSSRDANSPASGKSNGVKRSFSSFFPFSSCTFSGSTAKSQQSPEQNNNIGDKIITISNGNCVDSNKSVNQDQAQTRQQNDRGSDDHIIDYWDDSMELPSCDVCARAFPTIKQLAAHQRKKRHYGCIECDSIFPSREVLECHRKQMCHYEFAFDMYPVDEGDLNDEEDFFESDDDDDAIWDEDDEDCDDEEMERLL